MTWAVADKPGTNCLTIQQNVIAIVDDDAGMRNGLHNVLSAHGYRTELYASAEEFLMAAATSKAKCLLIDIQLGATSGIELAHQLSAVGYKTPIIFMTGSVDGALRRQAMKVDYIAYLHK